MEQTSSPLETEFASLTSRVLLFSEVKSRLKCSGFSAEEDEIKRLLGWHRVEQNDQLKREVDQLADALVDLEKAVGGRTSSSSSSSSSFLNNNSINLGNSVGSSTLPRKTIPLAKRGGGANSAFSESVTPSAAAGAITDSKFERELLEAQIAFFVDRIRRSSMSNVTLPAAAVSISASSASHQASSKRPQTATSRSIATDRHQSSSSSSSTRTLQSSTISAAGPTGGGGGAQSISVSRPATGGSTASLGRNSSSAGGSGSSYLSTGKEILDSVGILSPSSPLSSTDGASRKLLWDVDDVESREAIAMLKNALQEETEALEQDVEWLHAQMEALMMSVDDEPIMMTNNYSSSSGGGGGGVGSNRNGGEEKETEDLASLRSLKMNLQKTYLRSEQDGGKGGGSANVLSASHHEKPSTSSSSSSAHPVDSSSSSTDQAAAAARMRARRGLPTRNTSYGGVSSSAMSTTLQLTEESPSPTLPEATVADTNNDEERFFS